MSYTSVARTKIAAKNIEIHNGKTATMTDQDAQIFLDWADDVINSKLSVVCTTPLRQITRNSVTRYPAPIEYIATELAAGWMVESVYARIEPQVSDSGKAHKDNALAQLDELCNGLLLGSRRLEGQDLKTRNSFVNPYVAPLEPPKSGF